MKEYHSSLKLLKPLLKLTTALAITPPYDFGTQPTHCSRAFKAYGIAMITAMLSGYVYNLYGKVHDGVLRNLGPTLTLVDYVATGFLTLACVSTVLVSVLWRSDKFKIILYDIEKFDNVVRLRTGTKKRTFWKIFSICQIFSLFTTSVDVFTWVNTLGINTYKYYVSRNIMWYQLHVASLLILVLALEIERRFKEINNWLIRCAKGVNTTFLIPTQLSEYSIVKEKHRPSFNIKMSDTTVLKSIKLWYGDLIKVVEEFNSVFGLVLLFAVLFNIANVVMYTHGILFFVAQRSVPFGADAIVNSLSWSLAAFLQTLLIAAACERLSNEASRITIICHSLLSEVPSLPETDYEVALREELLLIAEQTANCHPRVSAAGFFEVNLGMMGFIVASVTSYIIVTIQFM